MELNFIQVLLFEEQNIFSLKNCLITKSVVSHLYNFVISFYGTCTYRSFFFCCKLHNSTFVKFIKINNGKNHNKIKKKIKCKKGNYMKPNRRKQLQLSLISLFLLVKDCFLNKSLFAIFNLKTLLLYHIEDEYCCYRIKIQ